MSRIRIDDIEQVAEMAQLVLSESEKETFLSQLQEVLSVVERLGDLDTKEVPPTPYGVELENVLRPDENRPSLDRSMVLQNAPEPQDGFFRVPKIID